MNETYTRTIDVGDQLSEVGRVQQELSALWETRRLPQELEGAVSLALEEALSNVLRHNQVQARSLDVRVTFKLDEWGFEFEVSDCAPPFDPLSHPDPDVSLAIEERRPGGLGIFLMKRLADEVSYEWHEGRNVLRFRKRLFYATP